MPNDGNSGRGRKPEFTQQHEDLTGDSRTRYPTERGTAQFFRGLFSHWRYRIAVILCGIGTGRSDPTDEPIDQPLADDPTIYRNVSIHRRPVPAADLPRGSREETSASLKVLLRLRRHVTLLIQASGGTRLERCIVHMMRRAASVAALVGLYLLRPARDNVALSVALWVLVTAAALLLWMPDLVSGGRRLGNRKSGRRDSVRRDSVRRDSVRRDSARRKSGRRDSGRRNGRR